MVYAKSQQILFFAQKKLCNVRIFSCHLSAYNHKIVCKNSKVFEQKGDLLNFKANIDPMAVLSRVKPG